MTMHVLQVKMTSGEDVILDVVEWEEDAETIQAKNVVAIDQEFDVDYDTGIRYTSFTLRPWMKYQYDLTSTMSINPANVVAVCAPEKHVIDQYVSSLKQMDDIVKEERSRTSDQTNDSDSPSPTVGNVVKFTPR